MDSMSPYCRRGQCPGVLGSDGHHKKAVVGGAQRQHGVTVLGAPLHGVEVQIRHR
jgi:hypothetical protein